MPIEIDLTHPKSRGWLADHEPTRFSRFGEPLSDEVIQRGVRTKLKEDIANLLMTQEEEFVDEPLQPDFDASIRSEVANALLTESNIDVVQLFEDQMAMLEEEQELEGNDLLVSSRENTAMHLLTEEISREELFEIESRVVNQHRDIVEQTIETFEDPTREEPDDLSYRFDVNRTRVQFEVIG